MSRWEVTAVGQQDRARYASFVLPQWQEIASEAETELLTVFEQGQARGALLARTGGEQYEIVSLFVNEENRRQGAGSALMEAAERSAAMGGCRTLNALYSAAPEEEEAIHRFFLSRGFLFPHGGTAVYSVPARQLEQAYLAKLPAASQETVSHIVPLSQLPAPAARNFSARFGQDIPAGLAPSDAPGDVLWDYSAAYIENSDVVSFVVFSKIGTALHLHAAYLGAPKHAVALAALLRRAYDMLAADFSRFASFTVTVINAAADSLAQKLLFGSGAKRRTIFYTQKLLPREEPVLPEWGGVLARSNALVSALADAGFGTALCMEPGVLPYLLWSPREDMEISVFYRVENPAYTSFSLTAQLLVRISNPDDAEHAVQAAREDPGPALLLASERKDIFALSASSQEGAEFLAEQSVEGFLIPFFAQAQRLASLPGISMAE